jgi:hypothetical protein
MRKHSSPKQAASDGPPATKKQSPSGAKPGRRGQKYAHHPNADNVSIKPEHGTRFLRLPLASLKRERPDLDPRPGGDRRIVDLSK